MNPEFDDFERLAAALKPWLKELVIVGGWAHRLHHEHPLAQVPAYAPVRTRDADVAFGTKSRLTGRIAGALADAGFREVLSSDETPAVAQYRLGADDQGFYAEFLTPLAGGGTKRDGSADATERRAGISAQKLRHLEILLVAPWKVSVGGAGSKRLPAALEVRVANPASFVAQTLLIHGDRVPKKRAQVVSTLTRNQRKRIHELRRRMFWRVTDVIRDAVLIPVDRSVRPEELRGVCEEGLATILADD